MIEALITVGALAAGCGIWFGTNLGYNRGFGDGMDFSDDWHKPKDIVPPGTICTEENGWTKTTGETK